MSTSIDLSFVKQFEREVHEAYQRQGSLLRATVRSKNNVKGASTTFQKVGKGVGLDQGAPRQGHADERRHTPIECRCRTSTPATGSTSWTKRRSTTTSAW